MPYQEIDLIGHQDLCRFRTGVEGRHPVRRADRRRRGQSFKAFLDGLPGVLKAKDLKDVAGAVVAAKRRGKPVIVMLGGHVIKTGCSPHSGRSGGQRVHSPISRANGSAAVHDVELACWGQTSEDVGTQLEDGSFGMASDTAALINAAAQRAADEGGGFGETVGAALAEQAAPYRSRALIACAHELNIPYTLHVALGTDIVHQHPTASGAAIGEASLRDFRILAHSVSRLGQGGVVLNLGSAVILPEVFLKTLAVARNLGHAVYDFITANFDMIQHYRPTVNVVQRPVMRSGKGYAITGHHEIMIPLLAATVYEMDAC